MKVIYQYRSEHDASGIAIPRFDIVKVTNELGEVKKYLFFDDFCEFVKRTEVKDDRDFTFEDLDDLKDFFIKFSLKNNIKKIFFITLQDFNYALDNSGDINELSSAVEGYSEIWDKKSVMPQDKFSFKNLFQS